MANRGPGPLFFLLVVVGGVMGLLAAYGALVLIRDHGVVNLESKTAVTDSAKRRSAEHEPIVAPIEPSRYQRESVSRPVRLVESPRAQSEAAAEVSTTIPHNPVEPAVADAPPLPPPLPETADDGKDSQQPKQAPPSAIIPMSLEKALFHVIATPDEIDANDLLCDIGVSPELLESISDAEGKEYKVIATGLRNRKSFTYDLPLHIDGAGAAITFSVSTHGKVAVCEVRPQFSLPREGIVEFTTVRGEALRDKLNSLLAQADRAQPALPDMTAKLSQIKADQSKAQAGLSVQDFNLAAAGAARSRASETYNLLSKNAAHQQRLIDRANDLIDGVPAMKTDLKDLEEIAKYAKAIAPNAKAFIRFYKGDTTFPAVVK